MPSAQDPSPEPGPQRRLAVVVDAPFIPRFFLLLQPGVRIRRRVGCSVATFLRDELKAGPGTIEKVQSLMLDGKPVDDIDTALVHDGSVLALSAAMPGLVGATLRRGGAYSSFRSSITYRETGSDRAPSEGWVRLKVFNLLMAEMGPDLLRRGVLVRTADILDLWDEEGLQAGSRSVVLDGVPVDAGKLRGVLQSARAEELLLTVTA